MNIVKKIQDAVEWADAFQQRHPVLAVPVAVLKKYGEDRGNDRVALLTYYAFLSLFPLLLLLLTTLEIILSSYPDFRETVLTTTLNNFPVLSQTLAENVSSLSGTWYRIIVSGIIALLASFGVANTIRNTINDLWQIPHTGRRGVPWNYLANLGIIGTGGLILIASTLITGWLTKSGTIWYFALGAVINFGLFLLAYRIATSREIKTKNLLIQSLLTAVMWQVLQTLGSYLIERQLGNLNLLYGSFAVVLGLLFWLYFVARMAVYAIEIDVVVAKGLWPRSIGGDTTEAGKKAYAAYAQAQKRHEDEHISVIFRKRRKKRAAKD
jgi:membrane protein